MKKGFVRKSCAILTSFVVLFSLVLFSGNVLYSELTVFAANSFDDVAAFEVESNSSVLPYEVELHKMVNVTLDHGGKITVKDKPLNKEAIVLFDSCYKSTETPSIIDFILSNCFYSLTNLKIQGNDTYLEGSAFVRETLDVTGPTEVNGVIRYNNKTTDTSKNLTGTEIDMEPEEAYANDDKLVSDEYGNFRELFSFIQGEIEGEIAEYPEEVNAKYIFKEENKDKHFSEGNTFYFDSDSTSIYIKREERTIGENEDTYTVDGSTVVNYTIEGGTFFLRNNMYFDGNLKISVPDIKQALDPNAKSAFIFATGNIQLQGQENELNELNDMDNIILLSKYGNIDFQAGSSLIKSIAFAPNGKITIHGNNVNLQGCFVANDITAESSTANFYGPSESQRTEFKGIDDKTAGFDSIRAAIEHVPDLFDNQTKVGIIKYSDYADINDFNAGEWKFYDIKTEKTELKSYVNSLSADTTTDKSNLGDALRRAIGIFNSDLSDDKAEKFIIIFTGMDPNAYTKNEDGNFETDLNRDINGNVVVKEEGDSRGNDYVERMVSEINNYNNSNKADIHTVLVDLSKFREDANAELNKPEIEIPQLVDLAANLGINVTPGNTSPVITKDNAYYRPTKKQVDNYDLEDFIIRQLARFTEDFKTRLAVEDLKVESAKFEFEMPKSLKPNKLKIYFSDKVKELDNTQITYTSDYDSYTVTYNFTRAEVEKYVVLFSDAEGKTYNLTAGDISLELFVNNDDNSFSGSTQDLKIEKLINIPNPSITYTFKDEDNIPYEYKVDFDEMEIKATYKKDIN